jgi:hypothetical protein
MRSVENEKSPFRDSERTSMALAPLAAPLIRGSSFPQQKLHFVNPLTNED